MEKEFRVSGRFEIRVDAENSDEAVEKALEKASFDPNEYLDVDTIVCESKEAQSGLKQECNNPIEAEKQENFCN